MMYIIGWHCCMLSLFSSGISKLPHCVYVTERNFKNLVCCKYDIKSSAPECLIQVPLILVLIQHFHFARMRTTSPLCHWLQHPTKVLHQILLAENSRVWWGPAIHLDVTLIHTIYLSRPCAPFHAIHHGIPLCLWTLSTWWCTVPQRKIGQQERVWGINLASKFLSISIQSRLCGMSLTKMSDSLRPYLAIYRT